MGHGSSIKTENGSQIPIPLRQLSSSDSTAASTFSSLSISHSPNCNSGYTHVTIYIKTKVEYTLGMFLTTLFPKSHIWLQNRPLYIDTIFWVGISVA